MKILALADEECKGLWDYYTPGKLKQYDLIISCGDLKAEYLRFLVTMGKGRLLYVHGNHDGNYERNPPEGCDCIEDKLVIYKGLRILGLGGSRAYGGKRHQYSQKQMKQRVRKLRRALRLAGGVDIVVTHAAPEGVGDAQDLPHQGFEAFLELMERYKPAYLLHGHVHMNYGHNLERIIKYQDTQVINCWEQYVFEAPSQELPQKIPGIVRLFVKNLWVIQ